MIAAFDLFRPHHEELRKRLIRSFLAIGICTVIAYIFIDQVAALCTRPLFLADPALKTLVYTKLTEAFISYIKLALLVGILVSFPYLLYQAWMFIAPGLLDHEKRIARRVVFWATGLFAAGGLFAFFIVLPKTLAFFMSYAGTNLEPMPKLGLYLTFVARLVLAFALAFEIPFLMTMASATGLINREYFSQKRKYFYIAIVILSFLLTAGDVTGTVLLSFPLFGLYEAGIMACRVFSGKKEADKAEEEDV
jgi:sec-independent protein translocase protein TatC